MELNLKGRKVLITGAGDGIGRSLALAFSDEEAHVAVCARSENRLHSLSKEMQGANHIFHQADLTSKENLNGFHERVIEKFSSLDILINNVGGILKLATFFDLEDEDWEKSFQLNLMPAIRLTRLFLPALKLSSSARIINISSIAAIKPGEIFPHYSAMKAALSNLTSSLAQALAPENILVNSVSPGPVWTRSWETTAKDIAKQSKSDLKKIRQEVQTQTAQTVLLNRMGVPEDITGIVLFLASDQATWITATNFTVDGGTLKNTL